MWGSALWCALMAGAGSRMVCHPQGSCLSSCCSASKLLSQNLNIMGSRVYTNVFTEQIKEGEKKGKASKWLWVFCKW